MKYCISYIYEQSNSCTKIEILYSKVWDIDLYFHYRKNTIFLYRFLQKVDQKMLAIYQKLNQYLHFI